VSYDQRNAVVLWAAGRVGAVKKRRCSAEIEEMIRKMLRITHGRSVTSCGSKNENAGFRECKSFKSRILHKKGRGG